MNERRLALDSFNGQEARFNRESFLWFCLDFSKDNFTMLQLRFFNQLQNYVQVGLSFPYRKYGFPISEK